MNGGAWWAIVHRVAKTDRLTLFHFQMYILLNTFCLIYSFILAGHRLLLPLCYCEWCVYEHKMSIYLFEILLSVLLDEYPEVGFKELFKKYLTSEFACSNRSSHSVGLVELSSLRSWFSLLYQPPGGWAVSFLPPEPFLCPDRGLNTLVNLLLPACSYLHWFGTFL